MNKVLVTYSSGTGATVGVAEAIGETLRERGAAVDVLAMNQVRDLTQYDAVVAGSGIRNKRWLPEAMEFVSRNRATLAQKPFAAFLVCITMAMRDQRQARPFVSEFMAPVRALVRPVSEGLFAGVLDISKVPSWSARLQFRLSVMMGVWTEGDHRDWNAIRAWAESVSPLLISRN